MLLTIHNLPPSSRYSDIKSLLTEKCGLTEIILDNLVTEGKGKKVTVGLANDDDGALVVRKINGLFLNGHQLYIEDRRRKTSERDQPYRSSASLIQEARGAEPIHSNNVMGGMPIATNVPMMWNYNTATPYMVQVPVEQNFAYSGYGGAPQAALYMEPQPVVPAENERGYSGFQGEGYPPGNGPRDSRVQVPEDWGRSGREHSSDGFRHQDRKRHHSPERPAVAKKRGSRWNEKEGPMHREASPPRQQWPQDMHQGPRPPFRQPEQFARDQTQYQSRDPPREPKPDYREPEPQWQSRWDEPNPRVEREREWSNGNNRNWQPETHKVWERETQPNPHWRDEPMRGNIEPNPQRKGGHPHTPERDRPEWFDRQPENQMNHYPRDQGFYERGPFEHESRPRQRDAERDNRRPQNDSSSLRRRSREPMPGGLGSGNSGNTSNRNVRRDEPQRRERARSNNARQERDWREDRSNPPVRSEDRSGDMRENSDYWRQIANDYPETKRPEYDRREDYNAPRHDQKQGYRPDMQKKPMMREEKKYPYPPKEDRRLLRQKPVEPQFDPIKRKPPTLTTMINKDFSNRGQATAMIAKTILGIQSKSQQASEVAPSPLNAFIFKQMKLCIRSRIDVLLGEELSKDMDEVIRKYRVKYPVGGDKALVKQIREKSKKEFAVIQEQREQNIENRMKESQTVKKEPEAKTTEQTSQNEPTSNNVVKTDQAKVEESNGTATVAKPKPILPPQLPKTKGNKPLTDKQVIKNMKLQRKFEYNQNDLYTLDAASNKALDDEVAELDQFFNEECSNPADPQEELICKRIINESLNEFNKSIRLYITKRFLNITTGLVVRLFSVGKLPKKEAVKQYLKKYRVEALKKSVKGNMYVINLSRFQDFDKLCRIEQDVIEGTPITFKAMNLTGPPLKIPRNQVLKIRQQQIQGQIEDFNLDDFEETTDYAEDVDVGNTGDANTCDANTKNTGDANTWDVNTKNTSDANTKNTGDANTRDANTKNTGDANTWDANTKNTGGANNSTGNCTKDVNIEDFTEDVNIGDFTKDDNIENFAEDVNIGNTEDADDGNDNEVNIDNDTENVSFDNFLEDANIDDINDEDLEDF